MTFVSLRDESRWKTLIEVLVYETFTNKCIILQRVESIHIRVYYRLILHLPDCMTYTHSKRISLFKGFTFANQNSKEMLRVPFILTNGMTLPRYIMTIVELDCKLLYFEK